MNVRELTLCAWETFLPKIVFFPQTSHSRAMPSPYSDSKSVLEAYVNDAKS
jgi:hypothetical protein